MAFRVGQKVVCVKYEDTPDSPGDNPVVGNVYTISNFFVEEDEFAKMCEMVELAELHQPGDDIWMPGYLASDYRPIVSTDAGMAILDQIRRDVTNKTALPIREDEQV